MVAPIDKKHEQKVNLYLRQNVFKCDNYNVDQH